MFANFIKSFEKVPRKIKEIGPRKEKNMKIKYEMQ